MPRKIDKGRIARCVTYLETELYMAAIQAADNEGETISSWLRQVVLTKLLEQGCITQDTVLDLAKK